MVNASSSTLKDRILELLGECKTILSGGACPLLLAEIENSEKRLMQPMQLAIIGKISSSKSTLVNAILGQSEVVRTGQMEETFNVSWLKHGDSDKDINVYFKNGKKESVPRKEWIKWASHQEKNFLKDQVKYIEVYHDHEILRDINIIDTPGLDALSQIDSKNTIVFLKEVHPDAVIMLFTKSIAESTLSILQEFQNVDYGDFNLSPMNAIGVLSKIDTIWNSMDAGNDILETGNRVIKSTLYDKYPEVRKSLFSILPVSALIGLGASTISEADLESLKKLSESDDAVLLEMLSSPDFFFDEDYAVGVDATERKRLYNKFGLFGIHLLIESLRRNEDANLSFLSDVLREKSGFERLLLTVQNHFGKRATLIKSQNILQKLLQIIRKQKSVLKEEEYQRVAEVESKIISTLLSMHEYREWEFLSKYYDGKLDLTEEEAQALISVSGEKGYSAPDRLDTPDAKSTAELMETAAKKALYWQKQYNVYSVVEPEKAQLYKLLTSSYNLLLMEIREAAARYEKTKEILNQTEAFLGVNKINDTRQ